MILYVLKHEHKLDEDYSVTRFIGVFSTIEQGELAMQRLSSKPGFCDLVDGFTLGPMVVDLLYWDGGFISFDELDARYAQQKTAE